MRLKNHCAIFLLILLLICSISAINAVSDENITEVSEINHDDIISVENNEVIKTTDNNIISDSQSNTSTSNSTLNINSAVGSNSSESKTTTQKLSPYKQFLADLDNKSIKTVTLTGDFKISKEIVLKKDITIDGKNHVIDAQGKSRIFKTTHSLTLKNIVLKNAKADSGAAISSGGSKLIIDNCKFLNNKATGVAGAAIWYRNGYIEIKDSVFENNYVQSSSGSGYGGAIYIYKSKSKITNTEFKSNGCISNALKTHDKATKYHFNGGAIYYHSGSSHSLTQCTFSGNKASNHGGAIFIFKESSAVSINKCTFKNNKAVYEDGGAISDAGSKLTITNSVFKNNKAYEDGGAIDSYSLTNKKIKITIKNTLFNSNTGEKGAGAIWMGVKTVYVIDKCNFTNNKASIAGSLYVEDGTAKITNCNFINNKAAKITKRTVSTKSGAKLNHCGGAIFDQSAKNLKISSCVFDKNKATYGGALHYKEGKLTFTGNTVTGCSAKYDSGMFASKKVTISNNNKWGAKKVNTKKAIKSKIVNNNVKAK